MLYQQYGALFINKYSKLHHYKQIKIDKGFYEKKAVINLSICYYLITERGMCFILDYCEDKEKPNVDDV